MLTLTVKETAKLCGCSDECIKKKIRNGKLKAERTINDRNRPMYRIALSDLPPVLQEKYYQEHHINKEVMIDQPLKQLDEFSADERKEIALWQSIIDEWQLERQTSHLSKGDFDDKYIAKVELEHPDIKISRQILYRKAKAYKDNDLEGLIDMRGKAKKGCTKINETVWQAFLSFYLDQRQHPMARCYEYTRSWIAKEHPELYNDIPKYCTFTRHIKNDLPVGTKILARYGEKAYDDRCAPYIKRLYDDLKPNDIWIADNHTFDVMVQNEDGNTYRLYLTSFLDARTGIFTGIYITDAPSSQATILALRNGIMKYGIPKEIYVDNGREFLTFDLGGLGHRRKKKNDDRFDPPPIFQRLGIKMTNALVRNAKAKIIERRYLDIKNALSRQFQSYTGGSVAEKPEQLKLVLKNGKAVLDEVFKKKVITLIEGYFNYQPYNGPVHIDKGKPKIQAFHEHMAETVKRVASKDDLNLMLMRSTRAQKVGRRGVHLNLYGATLDYWNYPLLQNYFGKQVYIRYDPDDLKEVRVYDLDDRYLMSVPTDNETILTYGANVEKIKNAMSITRIGKKLEKQRIDSLIIKSITNNETSLELCLLEAQRNLESEMEKPQYDIELQRASEVPIIHKIENVPSIDNMIRNAEKNKQGGIDNV